MVFSAFRLRLQDESRRCVEARRVEVSAFQPPGDAGGKTKLCLQLEDLRLDSITNCLAWFLDTVKGDLVVAKVGFFSYCMVSFVDNRGVYSIAWNSRQVSL